MHLQSLFCKSWFRTHDSRHHDSSHRRATVAYWLWPQAYRFAAPNLSADGESALLSTKKDGTEFVPSQADFQLFT